MKDLPETKESLWLLIVSPTVWTAHFLVCYVTAAIWCAKYTGQNGTLHPVRWAIFIYTVAALVGIALNGWGGLRRHRFGSEPLPHDFDTPEDRHRFLGFATLLLAGLSAIAVLFETIVIVFFKDCR